MVHPGSWQLRQSIYRGLSMSETAWTSDEIPFVSIGEGVDKNGNARLAKFEGRYICSERRLIKKRWTTLHRFDAGSKGEVMVFGSGAMNHRLAKIPSGTQVRLTYAGTKDVGMDEPMKDIKVEWPKGTVLKDAKPVLADVGEEEVPY